MKRLILFLGLLLPAFTLKAQFSYSKWGIGVGASSTLSYSDLRENDQRYSFNADLYYNYTPYMPFAFEIQAGSLKGGNAKTDPYFRFFLNNFIAATVHADVHLGQIVDFEGNDFLYALRNFYVGIGAGLISNNINADNIRRYSVTDPGYRFPGTNTSINEIIPLRFGYEINLYDFNNQPFMGIEIGYVHNVTFGEGLDGYADPKGHFKNGFPDMFRQINVGIKINFGEPDTYTKPVRQF